MKTIMNKALIGLGFALLLGMAGCSRQQSDWEKARAANTTDSYEQFIKKYPSGEFTAQAQARVKELYEEGDWQKARDADTQEAFAHLQMRRGRDARPACPISPTGAWPRFRPNRTASWCW